MDKKLILIQLNEINFNLVKKYIKKYDFKNLKYLLANSKNSKKTKSENKYELLEPWIQWFSLYTGKSAKDHGIFRLGDSIHYNQELIFNKIENLNYKVGIVSSMNAINSLKKPSYFIPDPWTKSKTDNSFWSNKISNLLNSTVNNNSGKLFNISNIINLFLIFIKFANFFNLHVYFYYLVTSFKYKWRKALFLDLLINDIHLKLVGKKNPNFSCVFLNAGAHIQHHHLFKSEFVKNNSKKDPIKEAYHLYDKLLKEYLKNKNYEFIIYTGLSQDINDDPEYYYRLQNHDKFLRYFDIKFKSVNPRMSRDFEIEFLNQKDAELAAKELALIRTINKENCKIFEIIDVRDKNIFVTLTYPKKIEIDLKISNNKKMLDFYNNVNFVAEKNGIHSEIGYLFYSENLSKFFYINDLNIIDIHNIILNYFND